MKNLKDILEASLLGDIEDTIKIGDKYNNVDLEMLMNAKSEAEFNIIYEILKDRIVSTEKCPEIVTGEFGHEFVKTQPGEFYITFYNRKFDNKEFPSILFGNKETVSAYWHPIRNKLLTSWSNMGFANLPNTVYYKIESRHEIRQLPKKWSKQISKLLIRKR